MAGSEYLTIASESRATIREKMSRFIAFAAPVATEADAKAYVAKIANEYHDARHVCWAYMLGADCSTYQSNDNGEPSGTAGKPILGQIRSAGLTNVVIAVVRYFGGIKLGTSGLIEAYRAAARAAIDEATIVSDCEKSQLTVRFPYLSMNGVMKIVKESGAAIKSQEFDNLCEMRLEIRSDEVANLSRRLGDVEGAETI